MNWIFVAAIRIFTSVLVLKFPLIGSFLGILADMTDVIWLDLLETANLSSYYNQFDKILDLFLYILMGISARKWSNKVARHSAWGLLAFRAIGTMLYEMYPARWLLLVFPNVFVWFFLFQLISTRIFKKDLIGQKYSRVAIIIILLAIPKLYQEYLFHVIQIPLYQLIKPLLFFLS